MSDGASRKTLLVAAVLLLLGSLQMLGDLLDWPAVRGFGAATAAAPAPKVFTSAGELETFSSQFVLAWRDRNGNARTMRVTPERYARLQGPYNRRNAYGAAVAYGPVLVQSESTRPMFEAVAQHGICGGAPLLRELGVDPGEVNGPVTIHYEPREGTDTRRLARRLEVPCR